MTNIFCSHWWIIDIIAIIHAYSNKWWFTLPAFHDIFITFTKKNVDNITNITLLNLAAIFQAVIWPEICAITSYYGNLKCHPFLWNGYPRKWALLLVEMDQDYLASDAGVIHVCVGGGGGCQFVLEKLYFLISCFLRILCYCISKIPGGGGGCVKTNCGVSFWTCWWEISGDRVALLIVLSPGDTFVVVMTE